MDFTRFFRPLVSRLRLSKKEGVVCPHIGVAAPRHCVLSQSAAFVSGQGFFLEASEMSDG